MQTPAKQNELQRELFAGIVTSLCFHNDNLLLVGHGPYLKVYNIKNGELLACEIALPNNRVHRIVPVPFTVRENNGSERRLFAVYGSKSLRIVELHVTSPDKASLLFVYHFGPLSDWIMDVKWLQLNENDQNPYPTTLAIAFAHNFVEIYNLVDGQLVLADRVQCGVRCILYSARLYGTTRDSLFLASGTVFNEVHLWKITDRDDRGDGVVSKRLVGHEGVIFGIRLHPDGKTLASVSDDRTIRIWPLADTDKRAPLVVFGHTSRIWDCQFVDSYLVSISEDSTCRVWRNVFMDPEADASQSDVNCLACWEGHAGKNVWSCAISPDHKTVATGGQDSGVRLWSLASVKNNNIESEESLANLGLQDSNQDFIRNFVLTDCAGTVAATNKGYLLENKGFGKDWSVICHNPLFENYAIMQSSPCGRIVVVGGLRGHILIYSTDKTFQTLVVSVHRQKLFEIFIEGSKEANTWYIVTSSLDEGARLHRLTLAAQFEPVLETLYELHSPSEKTTISSLALAEQEGVLICGSRESALLLYMVSDIMDRSKEREIQALIPFMQLRRSHGRQAISSVTLKQSFGVQPLTLWTTGRDGCFIEYRLHRCLDQAVDTMKNNTTQLGIASRGDTMVEGQGWLLEKVYRNKVTKGWLEGAVWIDNQLLLLGFYRKRFFVYNDAKRFEMITVACGGAHRRWQFKTADAQLGHSTFMFIRKEQLYAYVRDGDITNDGFRDTILQQNYHGREVRSLCYLDLFEGQGPLLFATAGEDAMLRIHQLVESPEPKFVTLSSIRKHKSVIKSIQWSRGQENLLFTSGGGEELYCWKLEVEHSNSNHSNVLNINCLEWSSCPSVSVISETRIMDTTVYTVDAERGLHFIGAAYSDSVIRIWLFNEMTRKFSLLADGTWHSKCILQIAHVVIPGDRGNKILFLTSATDGRVAIWDIHDALQEAIGNLPLIETDQTKIATKLVEPVFYYTPHQSGVNNLQVVHLTGNHLLVITGGEDNALVAVVVSLKENDAKTIGDPFIIQSAHASSITGVRITDKKDKVFTTSTDQRLNIWDIQCNVERGVSLSLAASEYVDVPDPSTMDLIAYNGKIHAAITGIGLQSFCKSIRE